MKDLPVRVVSKRGFDYSMNHHGLNDSNIEDLCPQTAIISINNTGDDLLPAFFKENHENVLNLFFDDVTSDLYNGDDLICKALTEDEAIEIFNFVKKHKDHAFIVHCSAGVSRSGAVGSFITEYLGRDYEIFKKANMNISPNHMVLSMLNRLVWNETLNK